MPTRAAVLFLLLGLALAACDNAEPDRVIDGDLVANAQSFFDSRNAESSEANARTRGGIDGLLDRFYPEWESGEVVTSTNGRTAVVAALGDDASVSFDERGEILRTLIVEVDGGGDPVSGQIVEFASPSEFEAFDARTLAEGWLAEDFDEAEVLVAEYDMDYVPSMARVFVPDSEPVDATVTVEECGAAHENARVAAVQHCYTVHVGTVAGVCVEDLIPGDSWVGVIESANCSWVHTFSTTCTTLGDGGGEPSDTGGGGGGSHGGGGSQGGGDDGSNPDPDDPEPCDTGDERIDDPRVQSALARMWEQSNADAPNVADRRETVGFLVPAPGGGWSLQLLDEDSYSLRLWNRARFPRSAYAPGTILVHTHPVRPSERILDPDEGFPVRYSARPSDGDRDALDRHGIETGLIVDGGGMRFFSRSRVGVFGNQARCGY